MRADDLFINNKFNLLLESDDLKIKRMKEKPVMTRKSINIKIPLDESVAKEWTLVSIPDRTRNVPKTLNEKHKIERKIIHLFKSCSCWVIISECTKARPAIHGIKETFSTGSQNHHPPQPSS